MLRNGLVFADRTLAPIYFFSLSFSDDDNVDIACIISVARFYGLDHCAREIAAIVIYFLARDDAILDLTVVFTKVKERTALFALTAHISPPSDRDFALAPLGFHSILPPVYPCSLRLTVFVL